MCRRYRSRAVPAFTEKPHCRQKIHAGIEGIPAVVLFSGVCKVNAAIAAQY